MSQAHILYHHVLDKRGLARACLADDIQMMSAIRLLDSERFHLLPESSLSEQFQFVHFVKAQKQRDVETRLFVVTLFYVCIFIPFRGFLEKSPETGLSTSPRTLSARSTNVSRGLGDNDLSKTYDIWGENVKFV